MLSPHEIRDVCQAGKDRDPGWYRIHRRLSIHVTARLLRTRITLRDISTLMLSLGVAAAALNASPHLLVNALGWACGYGAFLLDKVDGEVARYRRQESVVGILLDRFHHRMVEPLLFLAVGWRATTVTHSVLPVIAALAAMLAANIVEETQHLPAYIAAKHAREKHAWPVTDRVPSALWRRLAPVMRSLKTFRTYITVLPLVAGAQLLEALTHWPVTTWLLVTSAIALWVYALFQAGYYVGGQLEVEIDALTRQLPPLPERPRRAVTQAMDKAEAERARDGGPAAGPGAGPLAVLLFLALFAGRASAGTYFVDGSSAQCSSSGPGTIDQPYCSIAAAIAARGTAGNTILVQPGTYRETITFPASGTSLAPIVLRANSPGVVIDGADDASPPSLWVQISGNVWLAASVNWAPGQVFADGARLTASTSPPGALTSGTFRYVAGDGLYVNAGGGNPGLHGVRVGHRANAIVISNKSWITIDGFTMTSTDDRAISIKSGASDIAILNCSVTFSNRYGIYVNNGARVRIAGNVVTDHNDHGIMLTSGSNGCVIENNEGARNAVPGARSANGLYFYGSSNNTIRRNRWHHNQDTGQHIQSSSNNNLSYDNVSWSNGDHGYDHVGASGTRHFNDVSYGNFKDGFSIEGGSPNTQLTNCIAVNNGLTTNEFDLWVDNASSSGFVSNDNIFWNSTGLQPFKINKTLYTTIAAYQAATGQDSRSFQVDPMFVNPSAGDFHLLAGSPAIDNGNASSPDWPATDAAGLARADDPSTPNTGLGAISYSDRGANEYMAAGLPPVAALVASPFLSIAPAVVTLDASGSIDPEGSSLTFRFDFGDGTTAGPQASPSIVHTYQAGTFTASVTVADAFGLSAVDTATVISNQRPVASLAGAPLAGRTPLTVVLDATGSTDIDGSVTSYTFDFGDGTVLGPQGAPTATHVYVAGQWLARVTVTDDRGAASLPASPLAVNVAPPNQPPSARLALTPTSGREPLEVTADASASSDSDGSVVSYRFDFGDGTIVGPQPGASATHAFGSGPHTVTVRVTDNEGATATDSESVLVSPPDQAPVVGAPATVSASEGGTVTVNVTVTDADGDAILNFSPDLSALPAGNDAVFTPTADLSGGQLSWHPTFADSGTYGVTFIARNALSDTATMAIHVMNADRAPVASAPATAHGAVGSPIALAVSASDPDGDAIGSLTVDLTTLPAGHTATFTPAADAKSGVFNWTPAPNDTGHYALAFTAANALGGSATTVLTVTPPNQAPSAALAVTPRTGNAPLNVSANASASSDPEGTHLTYQFDFGDGVVVGPQDSPVASHKFAAGTWTLLVSVTDLDGAVSTASTGVTVATTGPGHNLVGNPAFEWNTAGWTRFAGSSFVRIVGGFDGVRSLRVNGPANLNAFGIDDSSNWVASTPAIGTRYRFGAWVRSLPGRGAARLQIRELVGGAPVGAAVVSALLPLTPVWQLVTTELVTKARGSTLDFQIVDQPQGPGEVFEVDDVSIHIVPGSTSPTPVTMSEAPIGSPDGRGQFGGSPPAGAPATPPDPTPATPPAAAPEAPTAAAAAPAVPDRFSVSLAPAMTGPTATLTLTTTLAGPVRIELYDLSGRRVRRVLDTPFMAPGLHNVTLDGRGDQGERLGRGVYFYRVQAIERSATGRFVLLR